MSCEVIDELTWEDLPMLEKIFSDPDFYYPFTHQSKNINGTTFLEIAYNYIANAIHDQSQTQRDNWILAIRSKEQILLGCVILYEFKNYCAEIGFFIDHKHQNKGIATRAAFSLIAWATANLHLKECWATVDPDFKASHRILQKLGMKQINYFEKSKYRDINGLIRPRILMHASNKDILTSINNNKIYIDMDVKL